MRNPHGYAAIASERGMVEHDTFQCGHCQRIVLVPPMADPAEIGGLCKRCMALVCPQCVAAMRCVPFEAALERAEARERFRRSVCQSIA